MVSLAFDPLQQDASHTLWYADEMGAADARVVGTGHAFLDAELPGGGWPVGAMTEVLQASPESHVWQLLLPALARAVVSHGGPVVLIGAPHAPFGPALAASGLPAEALMWVRGQVAAPRRSAAPPASGPLPRGQRKTAAPGVSAQHLWACEQALRCADVAAVLAWLPQARVSELRRLQLAAAQHEGLLFVFRPESVAQSASPARLRLQVTSAGPGQMAVHLLKRRGPPLVVPLNLPACNTRLASLLTASRTRRNAGLPPTVAAPVAAVATMPAIATVATMAKASTTATPATIQPIATLPPVPSAAAGATVVSLKARRKAVPHALDRPALA